MGSNEIIQNLFLRGLGQLLVLHVHEKRIYLGYISYEKGKLLIRDAGLLDGVEGFQLAPCWDYGLLGCLFYSDKYEWDSLSFCGLEHCKSPVNLSETRQGALWAAVNQYGENLIDFVGSVYRGYQLMLHSNYLPVITLRPMQTKIGSTGLAVGDLRTAPIDLSIISKVYEIVNSSVEKSLMLGLEDLDVNSDDFDKMFAQYLKKK